MAAKRLSLIIPYRDRAEHMAVFQPHIFSYFTYDKRDRHVPFAVTVVEQEEGLPFNIGAIRNVGFDLTRDFDYHCYHDVDFLPIWADYRYPENPARLIWYGNEKRPTVPGSDVILDHQWDRYFGGVVLYNREQFIQVNGYSNHYWGWGSEDDDNRLRCRYEKIEIEHRDGLYKPIPHASNGFEADRRPKQVTIENDRLLHEKFKSKEMALRYKEEGLNTLRYDVLDEFETTEFPNGTPPENMISWRQVKVRLYRDEGY